ncbi:MAG TPA: protein translocase subunit SecD [Gemmatimonadales bacterium]|nr:protein translocase subunit SecD [Gemmatimonadales bacterium]
MFSSIRSRLILIALLALASLWALRPREIKTTYTRPDGSAYDSTATLWGPNLGLDLQGGMHLALELDQSKVVSTDPAKDIDLALTILRKRIDEFGVNEPVVQKSGADRIVVELAGLKDPERARGIVQKAAFLEFRITDKTQALERALPAMDRALHALGVKAGPGAAAPAAPSAVNQLLGKDSTAADSADAGEGILSSLIQPAAGQNFGALPGEYMVPVGAAARVDSMLSLPTVARELPRGLAVRWAPDTVSIGVTPYRLLYVLADKAIMDGTHLEQAQAQIDPLTSGPVVTFQLDRRGGRDFYRETSAHVNDYMAILLDGRVQGRPPVINSRIDRRGQITLGNKTMQEAQDLALTLNAGALPVPLKIVEQAEVGASLGADSIHGGILAGLVGTALVILIMVGYYHRSGMLAVGGLLFYLLFTVGALTAMGATLTLPGLAGIVLSIGIAVDANVLIFERIREELDHGKSVRLAIDEGFKHAMNAIIDSNVTTVMTALFLFQFGTGPVKGFAVTLTLGIAASMITAIFVVRTFYMIWLQRKPALAELSI